MFGKGISINLALGAAICWKSVRRGNTSRAEGRDDRGKAEKKRRRKKQDGSRRVLKGKIYSGCLSNAISNAVYTRNRETNVVLFFEYAIFSQNSRFAKKL